ncbi:MULTISPECIES: cytochrome aa3 quinol oxidase subunit IV [Paenibacillus]|uniref:Quinol oxidase subunit 4 n=1 Tax=Paenibacillus silagei TaxID=1670801 RepID=A0ABS4NWY6_9BACL|nr:MULTISPECIES: cytochrome aa3 quinol oxidase subunit IV [Paenibacillus]ETT60233.1 cytochrome aa3 quinol oxidase subunit IV [Paenibacillus sp. FSL R7-277]MBP2114578.1 cytochrome aa3-600 menaquinol oxidase subunit 4 [Paenibacillus silagei]OMF98704.1 cytochrome aa3 quinol oxidase subunit IV [Paenibacillus sp. FSL R7-0333]
MMKQLFPIKHVMGYVASLVLSAAALIVIYGDLSSSANMVVLLVTALIQASLQLFVFMHIGESADSKKELYINIAYAMFVALVTIFGTLFIFVWGWYA